MPVVLNLVAAVGLVFFLLVAVFMVAGALWLFAHAFREVQFARGATISADVSKETLRASSEAIDELRDHPGRRREEQYPSEEELRQAAIQQTMAELNLESEGLPEHYQTTEDNALRDASANGRAEIPPDYLYEPVQER